MIEPDPVRRALCAAPDETTYAAARRLIREKLDLKIRLLHLTRRLENANRELELWRAKAKDESLTWPT